MMHSLYTQFVKYPMRIVPALASTTGVLLLLIGCGANKIPNTDVEENSFNRKVVEFVERYRKAVEGRNVPELLKLASNKYLDDNGTPSGDDDIDYTQLGSKLTRWKESVLDVRHEIRYRRVRAKRERIWVEYTYTASFRVKDGEKTRWARRLADNRLILVRNGESFLIISGM